MELDSSRITIGGLYLYKYNNNLTLLIYLVTQQTINKYHLRFVYSPYQPLYMCTTVSTWLKQHEILDGLDIRCSRYQRTSNYFINLLEP
jgi:hypothetical protein